MITLDKCNVSSRNKISDRICAPNKIENVNLNVFNLVTRTNESRKLIKKHIIQI